MDVQCERCKTEYEFDDALVSGRGTTVRCTNCGHQFKVKRDEAPGNSAPPQQDRWVVTTTLGKQLVYLTLRELQRAIMARQVSRSDTLTRGNAPPRLLGSIAELEPFFEGKASSRPPPPGPHGAPPQRFPAPPNVPRGAEGAMKRTPAWGTAAVSSLPPPPSSAPPTEPTPSNHPGAVRSKSVPPPRGFPGPGAQGAAPDSIPAPRARADTLRPPLTGAPPPAISSYPTPIGNAFSPQPLPDFAVDPDARTLGALPATPPMPTAADMIAPPTVRRDSNAPTARDPRGASEPPNTTLPSAAPTGFAPEVSSPLPPPTRPVRRVLESSLGEDAMAEAMRAELQSTTGEGYGVPRRRRVGGWVVAAVLLLGVGVVGFFVARPYMQSAKVSADALDPAAKQFLIEGEKALADGDLDAANDNFVRASVLADKDPRVLLDLARLAAARADIPWLKVRILSESGSDEARAAKQSVDDLSPKAKAAADAALSAAPEEPAAARAKIDAFRIAGDAAAARALVTNVAGSASQPETAYVLAMLDLTEASPLWATIVERLRVAASGEGNAGRARAALIYALARSGDKTDALLELERLTKLSRPHPLTPHLKALVERTKGKPRSPDAGPPSSAGDSGIPLIDVSKLPLGPGPLEPAGDAIPADSRQALQLAHKAQSKGNTARARQLYEAVITRNPNDSEALAGMGDLSRGDPGLATTYYKRALAVNPSYLPALIGLADVQWSGGNQGEARRLYREIVDRFPESTYPSYVRDRAGGGGAPPATAPPASAPPSASGAPPLPPPLPTSAPSTSPAPDDTATP